MLLLRCRHRRWCTAAQSALQRRSRTRLLGCHYQRKVPVPVSQHQRQAMQMAAWKVSRQRKLRAAGRADMQEMPAPVARRRRAAAVCLILSWGGMAKQERRASCREAGPATSGGHAFAVMVSWKAFAGCLHSAAQCRSHFHVITLAHLSSAAVYEQCLGKYLRVSALRVVHLNNNASKPCTLSAVLLRCACITQAKDALLALRVPMVAGRGLVRTLAAYSLPHKPFCLPLLVPVPAVVQH